MHGIFLATLALSISSNSFFVDLPNNANIKSGLFFSRPNLYKLIDKLNSIYSQLYYPLQPNHVWFDIHSKPSPVLKRIVIICMDKKVTNG